MRLLSTTILLAASTVLAKHKNGDNRGDDAVISPSSGVSPADQSGTTLLMGGSRAVCSLKIPALSSADLIVVANSTQPMVKFECVWNGGSIPNLNYVALRRYTSPTPSKVAAFGTASTATTVMSSASPAATTPPPGIMGGATGANGAGGSNTGMADVGQSAGASKAAALQTGPTMPPVVRKEPFDFDFQDVEFERRQTAGGQSPAMSVSQTPNTNVWSIQIFNAPSITSRSEAVYLELQWSSPNSAGSSTTTTYTPAFGIVESEAQKAELVAAAPGTIGSSFSNVQFSDQENSLGDASAPRPSSDTKSGDGSGNLGGDGTPSAPSATPESASASSSGLSTGAIAGIAVAAAVVGLAIIGLLIWMFLRRRRRANDHVSTARPFGRDQHTATADLMGEKEAAAGGNMESPHSPYSDDGHGSLPRGMAATGAAAGVGAAAGAGAVHSHHASPTPASVDPHRSSFTPYNDDDTAVPSIHADEARATGARSETPGGRYEHLMEQGMSAEDRARVEEEERQLDAEIERAKK